MSILKSIDSSLQFEYLGDLWSADLLEMSGMEIDSYAEKQIKIIRLIEKLGRESVEEIFELALD